MKAKGAGRAYLRQKIKEAGRTTSAKERQEGKEAERALQKRAGGHGRRGGDSHAAQQERGSRFSQGKSCSETRIRAEKVEKKRVRRELRRRPRKRLSSGDQGWEHRVWDADSSAALAGHYVMLAGPCAGRQGSNRPVKRRQFFIVLCRDVCGSRPRLGGAGVVLSDAIGLDGAQIPARGSSDGRQIRGGMQA